MRKLSQMPKYQAKLKRHGFDVSAAYCATQSTGHIVPKYFDFLHPGETVYCQTDTFVRSSPVVTAFFGTVECHTDWHFVPLSMLYTLFPNTVYKTDDLISSLYSGSANLNIYPAFNINDNVAAHVPEVQLIPSTHLRFDVWGMGVYRLMDALDMAPDVSLEHLNSDLVNHDNGFKVFYNRLNYTPWALLAYQCVYQNYYRNDDREVRDVGSYNIDRYYSSSSDVVNPSSFMLRYAQRFADYFTTTKVSPILSSLNLGAGGDSTGNFNNSVNQLTQYLNNYLGVTGARAATPQDSYAVAGTTPMSDVSQLRPNVNYFTTSSIRSLFAMEKLLRITGRADKDYDSQILAHFGYQVPHDVKHDITTIQANQFVMSTDPLYSTADTLSSNGGSSLGEVGGQLSGNGKTNGVKFTAPCHGILLCLQYFVVRPYYYNTFSRLHSINSPADLYQPELDDLGMQPLFSYELGVSDNVVWDSDTYRAGWQYRYQHFKQKYDRISNAFRPAFAANTVNLFAPWSVSQEPFVGSYGDFLSSPHDLDGVMRVHYHASWSESFIASPHLIYATDPFIVDFKAHVKKVSTMSVTGEPQL